MISADNPNIRIWLDDELRQSDSPHIHDALRALAREHQDTLEAAGEIPPSTDIDADFSGREDELDEALLMGVFGGNHGALDEALEQAMLTNIRRWAADNPRLVLRQGYPWEWH